MKRVFDFLKEAGIFYLATIDGDTPQIRAFGAVNFYKNKLYFVTGKNKNVYQQILNNSNIAIATVKFSGEVLRVNGNIVFDDSLEARVDMLKNNEILHKIYNDEEEMAVFYLNDCFATIFLVGEEPIVIRD